MIVVTGMHRSGTSLTANLLSYLGLDFGDPRGFYGADQWNEKGYYEQKEFIDLNHRIITGLNNTVGGLELMASYAVYITLPGRKRLDNNAKRQKGRLAQLGLEYRGKLVKDPRFCLTLPYWSAWSEVNACVVCLRHPLETVQSLKRRQRVPLALGFRFWNYHMRSLKAALGEIPTLYLFHRHLAEEPADESLERISRFFGLNMKREAMRTVHRNVAAPTLSHFHASDQAPLPRTTSELWDYFVQCYETSECLWTGSTTGG